MSEKCELCQAKDAQNTRLGIQLCPDCMEGFWKLMSNDKEAIRKYAKEEDFRNATINAKQQIISLAKRNIDIGVEKLEPRHVEKIEPLHMEAFSARNKLQSEGQKTKATIQSGLRLSSPESLTDLSAICSVLYVVFAVAGAILFPGSELVGVLVGAGIGILLAWIIKGPLILRSATYMFRTKEFGFPENVSAEEIYEATSEVLRGQEIYVTLEKSKLEFQHGSIHYQFVLNETNGRFRLRWYYSVAKALLSGRYIHNYKVVRRDTGLIAYTIQNIML